MTPLPPSSNAGPMLRSPRGHGPRTGRISRWLRSGPDLQPVGGRWPRCSRGSGSLNRSWTAAPSGFQGQGRPLDSQFLEGLMRPLFDRHRRLEGNSHCVIPVATDR
jgi:hypothetical protein